MQNRIEMLTKFNLVWQAITLKSQEVEPSSSVGKDLNADLLDTFQFIYFLK